MQQGKSSIMEVRHQWGRQSPGKWGERVLRWVNLRPEESERTFLMFAAYTAISIGILWLEMSSAALFLKSYGAKFLPWIYIASAGIGFGLSFIYSSLQQFLPLRRVIVVSAVLMAVPLLLFRIGLGLPYLFAATVFAMRLWLEAIFALNELNTSVTANQIFNIREIKRTYPLVSSGNLVADVLSGFSLPLILAIAGLKNILIIAALIMIIGAAILFYLSQAYRQAFPDFIRRPPEEKAASEFSKFAGRRLNGPLRQYAILLFCFFVLAQVLSLLIDFQYLSQLEINLDINAIAGFLGLFSGVLGLVELVTQWFISSRVIERLGVFVIAMLPPTLTAILGLLPLFGVLSLLVGLVLLKFIDELLRYTLVASTGPVLFQPIPDRARTWVQSWVRGTAEPLSAGFTGIGILIVIAVFHRFAPADLDLQRFQSQIFIVIIILAALVWLGSISLLRSRYLNLLVLSAERSQLTHPDVDLRMWRRAMIEILERPGDEADKRACIELLSHIDPANVCDILVPLLPAMSPLLQRHSLEAMLEHPNPAFLDPVQQLIQQPLQPEVLALVLRYVWLNEPEPTIQHLRPYLRPDVDPIVRGTAASLMMRRGNVQQKAEATNTLRMMLTHKQERERVMGCRALGEAQYMQALRLYVPNLLQDESLRVRRALLDAIAATQLEEYYPSLLRGLQYKSTREAAVRALVRLGNEAVPMLVQMAEDPRKSDAVRANAWSAVAQIGTLEAMDALVLPLQTTWGNSRRLLLRILLQIPNERGIEAAMDRLGRRGIEFLIDQELMFIGHLCAACRDLRPEQIAGLEADLLRRSLRDLQSDAIERLFLLMRFPYSSDAIQAAEFSILRSGSANSMARGLEILDSTLDIPSKRVLLSVLDQQSDLDKLRTLSELMAYMPLVPSDRLRHLLDLRHFLSDWAVACCFHLAHQQRWSVTPDQILACLQHTTGFVREAVLSYLKIASPRALLELLPRMEHDPDPLVAAQVEQLMRDLSLRSSIQPQSASGKA